MSRIQYIVKIDTQRDNTFSNGLDDLTEHVIELRCSAGLLEPFQQVAPPAEMRIVLLNRDGRFSPNDTSAQYYNLLRIGTLVRLSVRFNGTTTNLSTLRIKTILVRPAGAAINAEPTVTLVCTDIMPALLDQEYATPLQTNVRVDEALADVWDQATVVYPYDGLAFFIDRDEIDGAAVIYENDLTDFEAAFTTLPFIGDQLGRGRETSVQTFIRDTVAAEYIGYLFFQPRTEKLVFHNRYHHTFETFDPLVVRSSTNTFYLSDFIDMRAAYGPYLANEYTLNYYPRDIGTPGSVIFESDNVPIALPAQETREFTLRYRDPDNEDATIGAQDVIYPTAGTDVVVKTNAGLGGIDITDRVNIGAKIGASSATVNLLLRDGAGVAQITTLQLRGTPLRAYNREAISGRDADSIARNNLHSRIETLRSISDPDSAQNYVDFKIAAFANPSQVIQSVTFEIKAEATLLSERLLSLTIGDVVTLEDDQLRLSDYMIVAESHTMVRQFGSHRVTWIVRPVEIAQPFIIDSNDIDGTAIILV